MSNNESPVLITEHLSALLDDELGSFEKRRVLDELGVNQKLSQKLSTYALIGETLRTRNTEKPILTIGSSFLDSVREKVALEDNYNHIMLDADVETNQLASIKTKSVSWLRPAGGFAVAASVGALAFMGLQNMGVLNNSSLQSDGIANNAVPTAIVQSAVINPSATSQSLSNQEVASQAIAATSAVTDSPIATNTATNSTAINSTANNNDQYVDADAHTRSLLKRYVESHMKYATTSTFVPSVRVIAYTDNQ